MPSLVKHCTMTSMVAYAGATWDWHRIHYENEYVKARGIDYPVVDGQVFGAYAVQAIQDWLGSKAFVSSLDFRLSQLVYANEIVRCDGEITKVRFTLPQIHCSSCIWLLDHLSKLNTKVIAS